LFIAIYQMDTWAGVKLDTPALLPGADGVPGTPDDCAMVEVTARQFEWRIRYPGPDNVLLTSDDLYTVNDLRLPINEEVVISLKSEDVLHSFFLPNLRVKQDAVPGMKQYVWFKPVKAGAYEIVCAELCGWGHYKMKGLLTVLPRSEFLTWLDQLHDEQNLSEFTPAEEDDE
jgi:cytochrome c oxidase subunit 2